MADPKYRDRQLMIYLPSREVLERWRTLSKPYKLSHWVVLMVEKALEDKPETTKTSDDINTLRKENLRLQQENKLLEVRLRKTQIDVEDLRSSKELPMDKGVVDLLRSGGTWTSTRIIKELGTATAKGALRNEIKNNLRLDVKAIDLTLETLVNWELAKKDWRGWSWIK